MDHIVKQAYGIIDKPIVYHHNTMINLIWIVKKKFHTIDLEFDPKENDLEFFQVRDYIVFVN